MLVRCLYASRPLEPLSGAFVNSILEQSRKNNPALGITGLLCVSEDLFIQVIEGGRDEVCDLFNAIVRDQRHQQGRPPAQSTVVHPQQGPHVGGQAQGRSRR